MSEQAWKNKREVGLGDFALFHVPEQIKFTEKQFFISVKTRWA